LGKPKKRSLNAFESNDMPSTELGGNDIPEEGLNSSRAERREVAKNRNSSPRVIRSRESL